MARTTKRVTKATSRPTRRRRKSDPPWVDLPESELLDLRFRDLSVRIEGTVLEERIERLFGELESRGIEFRPHFWLAEEWFSPDGVPGIALPFYLAHPRLIRLERKMMLEAEGGTEEMCMRILRHETGHAIDTAYRLHHRRDWQRVFGKASQAYPKFYQPRPYSKSYVLHLDLWYAQSHPSEDFAETFAVWLRPRSRWRSRYRGWGALNKLRYVNETMKQLQSRSPVVHSRSHVDSIRNLRKTLRQHYEEKRARYEISDTQFYDRELRRLFSDDPLHAKGQAASAFLRHYRRELRQALAGWTGQYQYVIDQILGEVIQRCRELKLRMDRPPSVAKRDALVMLTVQTMNYLHSGHHRLAL